MAKVRKAAFMISAVAEQYQLHPQTLRMYEREGLLTQDVDWRGVDLSPLDTVPAQSLMLQLARYPAMLSEAAQAFAPAVTATYTQTLRQGLEQKARLVAGWLREIPPGQLASVVAGAAVVVNEREPATVGAQ